MHIFIDTNIFLGFYHFTSEDLDSLESVFGSHAKGAGQVHLTDQVRDEFTRNREAKINDALKRFGDASPTAQLPYFMREYKEYAEFERLSKAYRECHATLQKKTSKDIQNKKLAADRLIGEIFGKFDMHETTAQIHAMARMRMDIGNPPGKRDSIGDAINWLLLLKHVPKEQKLYLITDDADFYSTLDRKQINPFLLDEWRREKKSEVVCYRTLGSFLEDHHAGVKLSLDPQKMELIEGLSETRSFSATHALVAQLRQYRYFSLREAFAILDAATSNQQFGGIATDHDVKQFLLRALTPHRMKIKDPFHRKILAEIDSADDE